MFLICMKLLLLLLFFIHVFMNLEEGWIFRLPNPWYDDSTHPWYDDSTLDDDNTRLV